MIGTGVGEGAGIVGQFRKILHGDNGIVVFCMREGLRITFSDIGGENLAVTVQKQDLLEAV